MDYREILWRNYSDENILMHVGFLNESLGVVEYSNEDFNSRVDKFVKVDLKSYLALNRTNYNSKVFLNGVVLSEFRYFKLTSNTKWFGYLNVLINRNSNEYGGMLLAKTNNAGGVDVFDVKHNGSVKPSYSMHTDFVDYFTIVIYIPMNYVFDFDELRGTIMHELQHGFRYFRKNFLNNAVNSDILYFNEKKSRPDASMVGANITDSSLLYNIERYISYNKDIDEIIGKLDVYQILLIFKELSYYLNLSEIEARRATFLSDCVKNRTSSLINCSYEYYRYKRFILLLDKLRKYVPKNIKDDFAKSYLKDIEDIYLGTDKKYNEKTIERRKKFAHKQAPTTDDEEKFDNRNAYSKTFRHFKSYDAKSFDIMIEFFIDRIDRYFLKRCEKIYADNI